MRRATGGHKKQGMSVHFLPYSVEKKVFHLRLIPSQNFPFARAFLNQHDAECADLVELSSALEGVEALVVDLEYYDQNFFAGLNCQLAFDYLYAADSENSREYMHRALYYFTKAMMQGSAQAYAHLLVVLEDLRPTEQEAQQHYELDAQLQFWLDQLPWLLGAIDAKTKETQKKKHSFRRRGSSAAQKPRNVFSRTLMQDFKPAESRRNHELYSLQDDVATFSKRSAPLMPGHFDNYFPEPMQQKNKDLAVLLEVLAGEMARLFGAQEQPRYYFAHNHQGDLETYTEILTTVKTEAKEQFSENIEGMGRAWALKLLLSDNDPHDANIIYTSAAVAGNRQAVSIDTDRSLWPMMAYLHGVENEPLEIVQHCKTQPEKKETYDAEQSVFSGLVARDNTWRSYYTASTEDQLYPGPSAAEIDGMPNLYDTQPKVRMQFDEQYQQDPRFKHEFFITQLKYHISKPLEEQLIYDILGEHQRECDLMILMRALDRKKRVEALKQSQAMKTFLQHNFRQLGFVLLYEMYGYINNNTNYFMTPDFSPLDALNKTRESYLALLSFLGVNYLEADDNDLQQFCAGFYSDNIYQVDSCLQSLSRVTETYEQVLLMPSEALKVAKVSQKLRHHKGQLHIAINQQDQVYALVLEVLQRVKAQGSRLSRLNGALDAKHNGLIAFVTQDLQGIKNAFAQPKAIDATFYEKDVYAHHAWSENLKRAVDMLELVHVAQHYAQKNAGSEKATVIKNLIPLMRKAAWQLIAYRQDGLEVEPIKARMQNLIQLYIFILGARRHELFDKFRAGAAKLFGMQPSCTRSLREWQQTAGSIAEDGDIKATINSSTAMIEKGAQLSFRRGVKQQQESTVTNWAEFFKSGACTPSANQQEMINEHFLQSMKISRTASCAA